MRNAFLFSAVTLVAFFVTIDIRVRPDAGFHADFDLPAQMETVQFSFLALQIAVEPIHAL